MKFKAPTGCKYRCLVCFNSHKQGWRRPKKNSIAIAARITDNQELSLVSTGDQHQLARCDQFSKETRRSPNKRQLRNAHWSVQRKLIRNRERKGPSPRIVPASRKSDRSPNAPTLEGPSEQWTQPLEEPMRFEAWKSHKHVCIIERTQQDMMRHTLFKPY